MTPAGRKLLARALALPESERLELASELIASADGPPDADWEAAWSKEIERRIKRADSGLSRGEDADVVLERIRKKLRRPRRR